MDLVHVFYRFGIALIIGFLIGLQREYASEQEDNLQDPEQFLFAGTRTFALMGIFGCTSAFIGEMAGTYWAAIVPMLIPGGLITVAYIMNARRGKLGMTTEMAALMTMLIGALCYWDYLVLATALGVVTMTLLTLKVQTHTLVHKLSREDLYATVKFAIITAIVLPVLPQQGYGPSPFNVLVPFNIWLMVVFISGMSFFGYFLMKFVGAGRGVGLTGLLGGLVSSTALTLSFSQRSHEARHLSRAFALGIMAAWTIMFLRIMVIVAILEVGLLEYLWKPMTVALVVSVCYCVFLFMGKDEESPPGSKDFKNPFELAPAVTFGLLYAVILLAAHAAQISFGDAGVYFSSIASGLVDVDAVVVSMTKLSAEASGVAPSTASRAIVFAAASNTLVKGCIVVFTASASLRRIILPGMLLILATAVGVALFV